MAELVPQHSGGERLTGRGGQVISVSRVAGTRIAGIGVGAADEEVASSAARVDRGIGEHKAITVHIHQHWHFALHSFSSLGCRGSGLTRICRSRLPNGSRCKGEMTDKSIK